MVGGDIADILRQNGQGALGDNAGGVLKKGVYIQVQGADGGVDTDEGGEEGEDEKVGQLRRRTGDALGKIQLCNVPKKPDDPVAF